MISVVTYLWRGGRDFLPVHVDALARMVHKHMAEIPHRFVCVTDIAASKFSREVEVLELPQAALQLLRFKNPAVEKFPVSYPRLWTFSVGARVLGDRVLLLDTDAMLVRSPAPLLAVDGDFVGWRVRPAPGNPRRFGGGTWMLRTGSRAHVWESFIADPAKAIAQAAAAGYLGSDQAWISFNLSECANSREWAEPSGIYCAQDWRKTWEREQKRHRRLVARRAQLPGYMRRRPIADPPPLNMPADAIILHMNGEKKPWHSDDRIVTEHWHPYYKGPPCSVL